MNRFNIQPRDDVHLREYKGTPNEPHVVGERSRWRRFLEAAMPWLGQKWGLAECLAEAKVRQEMAQAKILEAQAVQEGLKTIDMAMRMEAEKMAKMEEVEIVSEDSAEYEAHIRREIEQLQQKMDALSSQYDARIEFHQVQTASVETVHMTDQASAKGLANEVERVPGDDTKSE